MEGHDFLTAHFCNNEKTTVEVYWTAEQGEVRVTYIEAKEGDPQWEELMTYVTIDELHENTYKHIREQNEAFEKQVIDIAKERGLIIDVDDVNTDSYKIATNYIFQSFDEEEDKEKLFIYKLQLFEVDQIKNSQDSEAKKKLRNAKSIVEATKIACEISLS